MQEEQPLDPPERELAEALGRLELEPVRSSPGEIWYRAGLEAGRRRANGWRAVAAAVTVAAGLLLAFVHGRMPATVERVVYVREPAASTGAVAVASWEALRPESSTAYARLRDALLREGLRALPPVPGGGDVGRPAMRGLEGDSIAPDPWYLLNEEG